MVAASSAVADPLVQQADRVNANPARDALKRSEPEVALHPLELAHARAVNVEHVGERFPAHTASLPMGYQVAPNRPLQLALHSGKPGAPLLDGLHTYK